jgi:hypothetical protein
MESAEDAMEFLARGRDIEPTAGLVDSALHSIKAAEKERASKNASIQSWLSGAGMSSSAEELRRAPPHSCIADPPQRSCSSARGGWKSSQSPEEDVVLRQAPAMILYLEDGVSGDEESMPSYVRVSFHQRAWRRFSE